MTAKTNIYDQHRAAFDNVSAFVIVKDGERVATVAFKFPRDGAGRLYAYVHWLGIEMVRGFADGYGYDKRSAAACAAARKISVTAGTLGTKDFEALQDFMRALQKDDGGNWDSALRDSGFNVWSAV